MCYIFTDIQPAVRLSLLWLTYHSSSVLISDLN
uniref:Uncharacterized protein n=1 Tax=Anguilla anguilla TaxID=7936 RepID=A0A0E9RMR0_ANGAN